MELELVILPRAQKDLAGLPYADQDRIKVRIEAYAAVPHDQRHDVSHWWERVPGIDCGLGTGG